MILQVYKNILVPVVETYGLDFDALLYLVESTESLDEVLIINIHEPRNSRGGFSYKRISVDTWNAHETIRDYVFKENAWN